MCTTKVRPWTSIDTASSAVCDPVAVANGATPGVPVTRYGPSPRIRSKPLTPKLRVAAADGAETASASKGRRQMRMRLPSPNRVKRDLRAADVARARLADLALGAAAELDVARDR